MERQKRQYAKQSEKIEERFRAFAAKRLADMTEEKKESRICSPQGQGHQRFDCKECGIQYETSPGLIGHN